MENYRPSAEISAEEFNDLQRKIREKAPYDSALVTEPSWYRTTYQLSHNKQVDITIPTMHDLITGSEDTEHDMYFDISDEMSLVVATIGERINDSVLPISIKRYSLYLSDNSCDYSSKIELYDIETGQKLREPTLDIESESEVREVIRVTQTNLEFGASVLSHERYLEALDVLSLLSEDNLKRR